MFGFYFDGMKSQLSSSLSTGCLGEGVFDIALIGFNSRDFECARPEITNPNTILGQYPSLTWNKREVVSEHTPPFHRAGLRYRKLDNGRCIWKAKTGLGVDELVQSKYNQPRLLETR